MLMLGLLIYSNALHASFQFDDYKTIVNNPSVKNLRNIRIMWEAFNTRILTGYSFAINYALGGLNVFGYHLVNILIHIFNSYLVYLLLRLIFSTPYFRKEFLRNNIHLLAFFAALVFLAHPIQTQAVTYITQRASCLGAFFYLLALIFYIKFRLISRGFYLGLAMAMTILAMLTKEMTVTIPFSIAVLEIFFLKEQRDQIKTIFKRISPFLLLIFLIPILLSFDKDYSILGLKEQFSSSHLRILNLLTEINVLRTYLRLVFIPIHQNVDYDYPMVKHILDANTIFSVCLFLVLIGIAIWQFNRKRMISFCIIWFFLSMSVEFIVCSLVAVDMIFEHYLYLPMVGFSIFLSCLLAEIFKKDHAFSVSMASIIVVLSILTFNRNDVWRSPLNLWTDAKTKSPNKARPYINAGVAYRKMGLYEKAIDHYHHALSLGSLEDTTRAQILINLGAVYGYLGNYNKEIEYCLQAIQADHKNPQAYSNLGYAYMLINDFEKALQYGHMSLKINPNFVEGAVNLGVIYGRLGKYEGARKLFERALLLDPDNEQAKRNYKIANELRKKDLDDVL